MILLALASMAASLPASEADAAKEAARRANRPPRVAQAERFLAKRGWQPGLRVRSRIGQRLKAARTESTTSSTVTWQSLGPAAVTSQNYGLVSGRISALALDPSDATGNTLYVGTTGGGVWKSGNANTTNSASVAFTPLTDNVLAGDTAPLCKTSGATGTALDASISIGALTVQPGGTGVILAGTGDPNDALDSYYGAGILRSADNGTSWCLIPSTSDLLYDFIGEGVAGFAWSTEDTGLVVAAVSQAYEGTLVNAVYDGASYQGLYYSTDSGLTWTLATIMDGTTEVQGPNYSKALPDGNAATAVVWNPVRQLFIAAVRYHGYYQSSDGVTWTRMSDQPSGSLTTTLCPPNAYSTGSPGCPIFRGALAVNSKNGDTFAWTVDFDNQDQGIWQDKCSASSGKCASTALWGSAQTLQWSTAALETNTSLGKATIENGDYNLALAAVPYGAQTMLLAGANDLWQSTCPHSQGCAWRNTTNSTTCMSAQVGEYQHALEWNASELQSTSYPQEILIGNDSGLWRSTDAIGESGTVCASTDASHFQNLNGSLGSLAEVESIPQVGATPYTMMAGLGSLGTAGVKSTAGTTADWPEILGGEGGPVAIDPANSNNWYVNNGAGVSIHRCSQAAACTPGDFGASAAVTDADVGEDGLTMTEPAPFLVDPLDTSKLLIGTCRVWRGPASGVGWSSANAVSSMLDGIGNSYCSGNALIRSMAALKLPASAVLPSGGEVAYVGMYGSLNGGATLAGHVLSSTYNAATSAWSAWTDLTSGTVSNESSGASALNYYGADISSIFIDSHDITGKTVYVTVAGISNLTEDVRTVYRSTDGGKTWTDVMSNLPASPANSVVVDPQDANTVYVGLDAGVYSTRQIANCSSASVQCWSAYGSGLTAAPVVELSAAPASATVHDLVAATYGRGIWAVPLWTSGEILTTATALPASLTFASQAFDSTSSPQTVTVTNTGSASLLVTSINASGDFSETDTCQNEVVNPEGTCTVSVSFTPTATGSRTGTLTIYGNVDGGQLTVALSGTGAPSGVLGVTPSTISFGSWEVGTTSTTEQMTVNNSGSPAIDLASAITGPFAIATNGCGTSVAAESSCNLTLTFTPVTAGAATGTLTFTDTEGTQTVTLSGTGLAVPTDTLLPASLSFPDTNTGQLSAAQPVTLTNSGGVSLTSIAVSVSGAFQQTNTCTAVLAANSSCVINVQFAPTAAGSQTGTLTVADALQTQKVNLSGTGIVAPVLAVSPTSLTFAGTVVGVASAAQTVTVSNTGGAALANVGFQITGASAASFSTGTTTCGATLASGASCTVQVTFTPSAVGSATAVLAISSSTAGVKAVGVPLSGSGQTTTGINVSPAQLIFPIVAPGNTSAAQTVTLTNNKSATATALTLTATAPFSVLQTTCGTALAAGASCTASVIFSPSLYISYTGTLTIASPSLASSAVVALSGTGGVPGSVTFQPNPLTFAQAGVGASSSATVTITNPDSVNSLSGLTITPAPAAEFSVASTTCGATLAPGASCAASITFKPASAGPQSGTLTVSDSVLTAGTVLTLSGTGFDFALCFGSSITPCATTSSQTVANGGIASYALTIEPLGGASASFTLQCGTPPSYPLPSYSSCTFSPTSPTDSSTAPVYETVKIATGVSKSSRLTRPFAWPALPLTCAVALVPLALWRRRRALWMVALLIALAGGVSSCGSSGVGQSSNPSGSGETPAGSYSIPVTVTSNGIQKVITLTLTVD